MLDAQGSTEKLSTRILAATLLAESADYLPQDAAMAARLTTAAEDGIRRLSRMVTAEGAPLWPASGGGGLERNDFATIQAAWAIRNAVNRGYTVDEKLKNHASRWLRYILLREEQFAGATPSMRCFALMVWAMTSTPEERKEFGFNEDAEALFNEREEAKLSGEDRAWLALGMHHLDILSDQRRQLLAELRSGRDAAAFDPVTFGTKSRAASLRLLARSELEGTHWSKVARAQALQAFESVIHSSADLFSTQENLWLLLVFQSLARNDIPGEMATKGQLTPPPPVRSKNKVSAGWLKLPLGKVADTFPQPLKPALPGAYLMRANYLVPAEAPTPRDPQFELARTIRNLTDASRTGAPGAPWQVGDQILVSYQLQTQAPHSHLEIEDQLPACLETVNSELPPIMEMFNLPIEAGVNTLKLSHVELRFARTLLYFADALPGRSVYSVVARVNVPGSFRWPAVQARAQYDARFSSLADPRIVEARQPER